MPYIIVNKDQYLAPYNDETGIVFKQKNQNYFAYVENPKSHHCFDGFTFERVRDAENFITKKNLGDNFYVLHVKPQPHWAKAHYT